MHAQSRTRRQSGNMLVLGCVFMSFVASLLTLAFSFGSLFFINNRLQTSANEVALAGARALNHHDQIGQMNNMIGRCRQLVYSSSHTYDDVMVHCPHLSSLAKELRDEAILSANDLNSQRAVVLNYAQSSATEAMQSKWDSIKDSYPIVLPWLKVSAPMVPTFNFGKIANTESNVTEFTAFPELVTYDHTHNAVRLPDDPSNTNALTLYKQCIDAKLPSPNSSLTFKLTSLSAPVANIIAPARIVQPDVFETILPDQIPSAAQVRLTLPVSTGLGVSTSNAISSVGTAAATGAEVQQ